MQQVRQVWSSSIRHDDSASATDQQYYPLRAEALPPKRRQCSIHLNLIYSTLDSANHDWGTVMKQSKFEGMSINELWIMHEKIRAILSTKLGAEKHQLERRLAQLNGQSDKQRRPYPKVLQKYQNPERPSETWSGRGKQPHWVGTQLSKGKKVGDLLVSRTH
jgi:DNA-binding protein H-NS